GVKDVPDGTPFEIKGGTYSDSFAAEFQNMMLAVQDGLGKLGIKLNITLYKFDAGNDDYFTGADDIYVEEFWTGVDTINQFQLYSCDSIPTDQNRAGLNGSHICNADIDNLWKVLGTSMSADERQTAASKIQSIMADQVLNVYLANLQSAVVFN